MICYFTYAVPKCPAYPEGARYRQAFQVQNGWTGYSPAEKMDSIASMWTDFSRALPKGSKWSAFEYPVPVYRKIKNLSKV